MKMTWSKVGKIAISAAGVISGLIVAAVSEKKLTDEVAPNRMKLSDLNNAVDLCFEENRREDFEHRLPEMITNRTGEDIILDFSKDKKHLTIKKPIKEEKASE